MGSALVPDDLYAVDPYTKVLSADLQQEKMIAT